MAAIGSVIEQLPEAANADGEFRLAARHWTGSLLLASGDQRWAIDIADGQIQALVPGGSGGEGAGHVTMAAPQATWEGMLAAMPAPFLHDPIGAVVHGLVPGGYAETNAQYRPAIRRLVELLRELASGESARRTLAPEPPPGTVENVVGRYVHLDIGGLSYRLYFEEAGSGVPLLLQHTAGADGRQWRHVLNDPGLQARFRMIAYDLPYHGKSVPPTGLAWWRDEYRLTRDFLMAVPVTLARTLGLERPVFMGCSIGGHLAADLAYYHPGEFRAVVGLEAALKQVGSDLTMLYHPRVSNEYKASLMYGLTAPSAPEAYRRETAFVYSQGAPPTFAGDLYYWQTDHDLTDKAKDIDTSQCPVYLLTGEYDWATQATMSRALAAEIPGATFEVMKGLGHFPMSEDPERFLEYVRPVLERVALDRAK